MQNQTHFGNRDKMVHIGIIIPEYAYKILDRYCKTHVISNVKEFIEIISIRKAEDIQKTLFTDDEGNEI